MQEPKEPRKPKTKAHAPKRYVTYEDTILGVMRQLGPASIRKVCVFAQTLLRIQTEREQKEQMQTTSDSAVRNGGE